MPEHRCRWDTTIVHYPNGDYDCECLKSANMAVFLISMWGSLFGLAIVVNFLYIKIAPQDDPDLSCGFFDSFLKGTHLYVFGFMFFLGFIYFFIDIVCRCGGEMNYIYEATNQMKRLSFAILYMTLGISFTWLVMPSTFWKIGPSSYCLDVIRLGNDSHSFDQNTSAYFESPLDEQIYSSINNKINSNLNQSVLFLGISQIGKTVSLQRVLSNVSTYGVPSANVSREQFLLYYYSFDSLDYSKQYSYVRRYYTESSYNLNKIKQSIDSFQKLLKSLSDKKTILFFVDGIENISTNTTEEQLIKNLSDLDKNHSQFHLFLVTNSKFIGSTFYTDQYFLYNIDNFVQTYLKSTPPQLIQKYFREKGNSFKAFSPQYQARVEQMQRMYPALAKMCNNYEEANYLYGKVLTEYEKPIMEVVDNIKNLAYNTQITIINNNLSFLCSIFFGEKDQSPLASLVTDLNKILFNFNEMRSKILQIAFIQRSSANNACKCPQQKKKPNKKNRKSKNKKQQGHRMLTEKILSSDISAEYMQIKINK